MIVNSYQCARYRSLKQINSDKVVLIKNVITQLRCNEWINKKINEIGGYLKYVRCVWSTSSQM